MSIILLPAGTVAPEGRAPDVFSRTRPPGLLAREIDPTTGELTSMFHAPHPVDAAIVFQARTRQGSGEAVRRSGTRYHQIRNATDTALGEYHAETRRWMRPFVDRQLVDLLSVAAQVEGDMGSAYVSYRNRLTNAEPKAKLP